MGGTRSLDKVVPNSGKLDVPDLPALSTLPIGTESGSDVQPLLKLLVDTTWPAGQIEAVTGLAKMLANTNDNTAPVILNALRKTPGVYQQLQELSASPEFEVNYPAKALVSQLDVNSCKS